MTRTVSDWHEFAQLNEGCDCTCELDPATCEAMVWARRRAASNEPLPGQLSLGQPSARDHLSQLGADDQWDSF